MPKRENTSLNSLENVFSERTPKTYSDEELLGVIRSPDTLAEKDKAEQLLILGEIAQKMQSSEDFKRKVLEEIGKLRQKPSQI